MNNKNCNPATCEVHNPQGVTPKKIYGKGHMLKDGVCDSCQREWKCPTCKIKLDEEMFEWLKGTSDESVEMLKSIREEAFEQGINASIKADEVLRNEGREEAKRIILGFSAQIKKEVLAKIFEALKL